MIKNPKILKKFNNEFIKKEGRIPFKHSLKIFESLWNEAKNLGVFPPKAPLEGIDVDIKIAKILNSCLKKSSQK